MKTLTRQQLKGTTAACIVKETERAERKMRAIVICVYL